MGHSIAELEDALNQIGYDIMTLRYDKLIKDLIIAEIARRKIEANCRYHDMHEEFRNNSIDRNFCPTCGIWFAD